MQCLICEHKNFKINSEPNWEPMQKVERIKDFDTFYFYVTITALVLLCFYLYFYLWGGGGGGYT